MIASTNPNIAIKAIKLETQATINLTADIAPFDITLETMDGKRLARNASLFKASAVDSATDECKSETAKETEASEMGNRRSTRIRKGVQRYNGVNRIESGEEML